MWRFQIHDTVTGRLVDVVNPASGSWTRRMSGKGDGSHVFVLSDAEYDQPTWRDMLEPWSRTLVVLWGFAPIYAGIITSTTYDYASGTVSVRHDCIRKIFEARQVFAHGNYEARGRLRIQNKSPWGALRQVMTRAVGNTGRGLPIDWSQILDGPGDVNLDFTAPQLATIDDVLAEIENLGYDIDFVPRFVDDHQFAWMPTVGSPLVGPMVEYALTAAGSPFDGVQVTIDAAKAATSVVAVGNGSGEDMRLGWAPSGAYTGDGPALERKDQAKRQDNAGVLGSIAMARLAERRWATVQWSFSVDLEDETPVAFVPTNRVRMHTVGDPWLRDGHRDLRVIALAGDMTMRVRPEVQ